MNKLLLLFAGFLAYKYYQNVEKFKNSYRVRFLKADFDRSRTILSDLTRMYVTVNLEVDNPSELVGKLNGGKFYFTFKNKNLGVADIPIIQITPGITKLKIPLQILTANIASQIPDLIQMIKNGERIVLNIQGKLDFSIGTVYVNENYAIEF